MAAPVLEWLRRNDLAVKTEFGTPWGICDMVGVKFRPSRVRLRLSYGQKHAVGPALRLHVLSRIPDQESGAAVTFRRLHAESFACLSLDRLRAELEHLTRGKFIASPRRGAYHKLNGWAPLHHRIVAVELKLCKVSQALRQARSNLAFATESYMALPMDRAFRVAHSRLGPAIRKIGVGLLGVSLTKCERFFTGSRVTKACDEILQAHCVERFWRTRDNSP
jgi:hypothetical protein